MKKDVLIIEDDNDTGYLVAYVLKGAHYEVRRGASASDLEFELSAKLPDVILLDIMLPDGNGIDLCRKIKKSKLTSHIPVIIMSAHQSGNLEAARADGFINKTFRIMEVIASVKRVC
ncbi:hypothetical protein A8C56_07840 [Niabella ginsenosidivorans]|uniref:Response regulatory domain-containing protein n=1 Tax=Niabella ginsenosidivorans TaxID=1176587 RepID=A0A1A9I081_9BACT|nr:response regulator [Niabella ginsenosidivorans]ANH80903.1 hypothetical protein A8C56_07840 [Niabella ginsenosidivorans]